ncbi:hypothetical protein H310_05178 [Aphanomyces invadans]|uniref:Uncharacterized protein n=1 Tax=Aphanomyces invadans TaxID=157072 RepID=A0A024UDV5_9STRA|nr:hypothetical protein H310_05178 [Aphanomyces invadans]ETW03813.1 hypothetical protein H310_05178 [Aphanomyces invadans]|eukprot:XP_008868042.1 hypothetical protein H310_05178 [Aphanomyces invadans]
MPSTRTTGLNRRGSNEKNRATSEPVEAIKTPFESPAMSKFPHTNPSPSPTPPPRQLMELFPPLPTSTYVQCLQRHAYLVEKLSKLGSTSSILDPTYRQVLTLTVTEILDASSATLEIASLTLPPTLRFMLHLLIAQEHHVWPKEVPSPELVVGLCNIHVLLWRVTTRIDAILAQALANGAAKEAWQDATPLEDINANLKLRLALIAEEWANVVCTVVRNIFQAVAADTVATGSASNKHEGTPFMTKLLHELLRPMGNFVLTVDDDNAKRYVLTHLLDNIIDTTIEELVSSVGQVTESDRRHLQGNIDQLKAWIEATCDRLSTLPSVKRLDRLNQEWSILGVDNRRRRSSFDVIMDSLTSDSIARFYRGKHQQSVGSMRHLSTKTTRRPSSHRSQMHSTT